MALTAGQNFGALHCRVPRLLNRFLVTGKIGFFERIDADGVHDFANDLHCLNINAAVFSGTIASSIEWRLQGEVLRRT